MASPLTPQPGYDTPGGDPMAYYEPHARWGHWTALINGKLYTYGGCYPGISREPPSVVELFDVATELWVQSPTSGPPPPGFIDAVCVVMGENCYHFGGRNGVDYFNGIHKLNSHTLIWKELKPMNPHAAPMCKAGTCMVSFSERYLVTFAGYGTLPEHPHRGAEYVPDPKFGGRRGWTNELLVFDTSSRRWSSPETTGSPPPPCTGATFTRVDHHRAVVYGGGQLRKLLPNHIHILDMQSWMWIRTAAGGGPGQPWPVARSYHSAVSLHHPDGSVSDPALVVWWGDVGHGKAGRDAWVFQVNTLQWREISLPDALRGWFYHTTTIVHCDSTLWKVINIGGVYEWPLVDSLVPVSETAIVELRSSGTSGDLVVTDVKFKGRRTPSLGQPWRASESPLVSTSPLVTSPPLPEPPVMSASASVTGDAKRPHKARTSITSGQQDALVEVYSNDPKPSKEIREELAAKTGLEMKVIQTWFQNRRSKEKREATQRAGVLLSSEYPLSSPPLEVVTSVPTTTKSTVPADIDDEKKPLVPELKPDSEQSTSGVKQEPEEKRSWKTLAFQYKQALAEKCNQLDQSEDELAKMDAHISMKDAQIAERDIHIAENVSQIAEMESHMVEVNEAAKKITARMKEIESHVVEKDEQIAERDRKIAEKDEEIAERDRKIAEKDVLLARREEHVAEKEKEISSLKAAQAEELRSTEGAVGTSKDVTTTDYLRGMEVVAGTTFHLSGRRQTHVWEGHGLRLHIPDGALPPSHTGCQVDVRAGLAGQFQFSEGSHPVSGMYWLSCKERFLLPATLELQHCTTVRDATQCSRLRFAIAKCSQPELPYNFKSLDRGVFTPNSSYGSISLSQFSIVAITEQTSQGGEGSQEPQQPLQHAYCAKLFYLHEMLSQWQLDFTITQDLELYHKHVNKTYKDLSARLGPHVAVQFEEDHISLDIPDHVTVVEGGWKIVPLTPPLITKEQVDNFKTGRRIPTCQLKLEWIKEKNPVNLDYRLNLLGAKEPFNFMYFSISPGGRAATGEKRRLQHDDDTEQENDIGQMKKRKSDNGEEESSASESSRASSNTGTSSSDSLLTNVNKFKIVHYLERISRNQDLVRLGEGLGLNGTELRKRKDSDAFLDDLVRDWLERKYRVDEVGEPTWRKLVEVLRDVEQNGLANDIEKEQGLKRSN